jgi:hypothetical protein
MHRGLSIHQQSSVKGSSRHLLLLCLVLLSIAAYPTSAKSASQQLQIQYSKGLLTLTVKNTDIKEFFSNFLRNMNYALILSVTDSGKKRVTDVYVYPDSTTSSLSDSALKRISSRIAAYKRNIEKAKEKLGEVGADSTRGKTYLNRINRYEKRIEALENQL